MILVDTSVWIDHLRAHDSTLARLLEVKEVLAHPYVTGELALGNLPNRGIVLRYLESLSQARIATPQELLHFIQQNSLFGLGIGYVDAHLLASVRLTTGAALLTYDKRLAAVAERLRIRW
jgi:predicted nucleic acid-binding protein